MLPRTLSSSCDKLAAVVLFLLPTVSFAQNAPYDVFPAADPPYYRVRYEASAGPGELTFPVNYTVWIPKGVETLRGVVVHQHGCGEGSCKSGLTGAYDLHWQALQSLDDYSDAEHIPFRTVPDVLDAVGSAPVDAGFVPVERDTLYNVVKVEEIPA